MRAIPMLQGLFIFQESRKRFVQGGRFVLIDDVFTTGATLEACARTLKKAGAACVQALTLLRVIRPVTPEKEQQSHVKVE